MQVKRPLRLYERDSTAVPTRSEVAGGECQRHARVVKLSMTSRDAKEFFSGGPKGIQLNLDHLLFSLMRSEIGSQIRAYLV